MSKRYQRNMMALSPEENHRLRDFKICVAGCGGLGGYVIEELGRLGIGFITAIDGDVFDETNLNRQILATINEVGCSKSEAAKNRMTAVNPDVTINAVHTMITEENCRDLICGHDLVVDALDSVTARLLLEKHCEAEEIPMIHGAIAGWYGQVSVIFPGDRTLEKLYPANTVKGAEVELGNPSFIPGVVASIQVAEALKVLLGRGNILRNKLLTVNLLDQEYEILGITG